MSIKKFISEKQSIKKAIKLWEDNDLNGNKYLSTNPRVKDKINMHTFGRQRIYHSEILDLDNNNKLKKKDIIEESVISDNNDEKESFKIKDNLESDKNNYSSIKIEN